MSIESNIQNSNMVEKRFYGTEGESGGSIGQLQKVKRTKQICNIIWCCSFFYLKNLQFEACVADVIIKYNTVRWYGMCDYERWQCWSMVREPCLCPNETLLEHRHVVEAEPFLAFDCTVYIHYMVSWNRHLGILHFIISHKMFFNTQMKV